MKDSHVYYLGKYFVWVLSGKYARILKVNSDSNVIITLMNPLSDVCCLTKQLVKIKINLQILSSVCQKIAECGKFVTEFLNIHKIQSRIAGQIITLWSGLD